MKIYTIFNRKKPHQTWVKAVILNQRRFCSLVDLETFLVVTTIVQGCCYTPHNVQDSTLQTRIIWLKMSIRSKEGKQIQTYNKKYRKVISKQVFMYLYSKKKKNLEKQHYCVHYQFNDNSKFTLQHTQCHKGHHFFKHLYCDEHIKLSHYKVLKGHCKKKGLLTVGTWRPLALISTLISCGGPSGWLL